MESFEMNEKDEKFEKLLFLHGAQSIIDFARSLYQFAVYLHLKKNCCEFNDLPIELVDKLKKFSEYVFCYEPPKNLSDALKIINAVFYGEVRKCRKPKTVHLDALSELLKML